MRRHDSKVLSPCSSRKIHATPPAALIDPTSPEGGAGRCFYKHIKRGAQSTLPSPQHIMLPEKLGFYITRDTKLLPRSDGRNSLMKGKGGRT